MKIKSESLNKRKQDTRRKIQMGGLFVTAKLDHLFDRDKAIILGMIMEAASRLNESPDLLEVWQGLGKERFGDAS